MTNTIGSTSDWHSLSFSQDFDGYLFVPLTAAGFTNLQLMADSNAYVGFHFEHKPNYAPEYFVDAIGTYYGTDVQAVLADLLAQRTDADYTAVDAAIRKAQALDASEYSNFAAVESAVGDVVRGYRATRQAEVDAMASAIEAAIAALTPAGSDSSSSSSSSGSSQSGSSSGGSSGSAAAPSASSSASNAAPGESSSGSGVRAVQTGDSANPVGLAAAALVSLALAAGVLFSIRKRTTQK